MYLLCSHVSLTSFRIVFIYKSPIFKWATAAWRTMVPIVTTGATRPINKTRCRRKPSPTATCCTTLCTLYPHVLPMFTCRFTRCAPDNINIWLLRGSSEVIEGMRTVSLNLSSFPNDFCGRRAHGYRCFEIRRSFRTIVIRFPTQFFQKIKGVAVPIRDIEILIISWGLTKSSEIHSSSNCESICRWRHQIYFKNKHNIWIRCFSFRNFLQWVISHH